MIIHTAIDQTLVLLPKRMRDVLARRFGLGAEKKEETLEAIGKDYGITRERVRQIEAYGLAFLQRPEAKRLLAPFVKEARNYFEEYGGLKRRETAEEELSARWSGGKNGKRAAAFALEVSRVFINVPEAKERYAFWALNQGAIKRRDEFVRSLVSTFKERRALVGAEELPSFLTKAARKNFAGAHPSQKTLSSYLETTKIITVNPFGSYGLALWPEVNPRGVRDYAYLVFRALAQPLHFKTLAERMNDMLRLKRRAHEQTVHNELIKDRRFVLVGRGIYGLKEWGYQSGTVREVLSNILASAPAPLKREEIMEKIKAQRLVKENTVFLNLQNRRYFARLADGRYAIKKGMTVEKA